MPPRLLLVLGLTLAGCAAAPPPVPTQTELTYLTRSAPAAALDSVVAWAARSPDLVADRAGATLTLRDRRSGQDNVATITAERYREGATEVTVRNRYVVARDVRDLGVAMALGSLGGARYLVPLGGAAPCFSREDWLAGGDPYPEQDADGGADRPPVLVGGLAAMQRRAEYPLGLRREGVAGVVLVEFAVGETGAVECAQAVSSPHPELSAAVLAAVRAAEFEPGGAPGRFRFLVPMTFRVR